MSSSSTDPFLVEPAGPVPDQERGDRVAGEVGQRPGLGPEPVDADDQADALDQVGGGATEGVGEGREAGAGMPGSTATMTAR
jgi:hypothetical protein